jgi:hypothetical protein
VESSAINKSLFVLAQCVEAISKKQSRVPYRESKMTRILSLGQNNGLTLMILNLAPVRSYHLDTLSSLNFANRTKKIEVAEVENEPMYRHIVKPLAATASIGGATMKRQPLRPLNAAHNVNLVDKDAEKKKPGEKPVKAFSVYSDRKSTSRPSNIPSQNQGIRRTDVVHKRAADSSSAFGSRPSKVFRAGDAGKFEAAMSKESIEALISQRIEEKLAEKALQDASAAAPALSAELQRRLDELEHRIDAQEEDGKSQGKHITNAAVQVPYTDRLAGLQFLLMAKQHQVRGEEASALRMYQMALPYFPGNEKLKTKMRNLEERLRAKREGTAIKHVPAPVQTMPVSSTNAAPAPASSLMAPLRAEKKQAKPLLSQVEEQEEDDEFAPAPESDDESYASDGSFQYKSKSRRKPTKKATKKLPVFRDAGPQDGDQTPRTARLLRIINSRDVGQIKALKGVGTKKADAIVNCLVEMEDEEVRDLESLAQLKGVGGRTVENMRLGLTVEVGF